MQLQMIINSLGLGRLLFIRVTNLINAYHASYSSAISSSVCIVKVYSTKTTGQILFPLAIKKLLLCYFVLQLCFALLKEWKGP
jgi:hypothetical protein